MDDRVGDCEGWLAGPTGQSKPGIYFFVGVDAYLSVFGKGDIIYL